jgi:hypothetical protein
VGANQRRWPDKAETMDFILKHAVGIISIDKPTLMFFLVICAAASWIVKDSLANSGMIIVMVPFLLILSMVTYYLFLQGEFVITNKLQSWLLWCIVASTVGLVVGLGIIAGITRLLDRDAPGHSIGG